MLQCSVFLSHRGNQVIKERNRSFLFLYFMLKICFNYFDCFCLILLHMQVSSQFGFRTQTHSTFKIMLKTLLFRKAYSLVVLDLGFRCVWGGLHSYTLSISFSLPLYLYTTTIFNDQQLLNLGSLLQFTSCPVSLCSHSPLVMAAVCPSLSLVMPAVSSC